MIHSVFIFRIRVMHLIPTNTKNNLLDNIPEKELPFYRANWDPFKIQKEWDRLQNDQSFFEALKEILHFNALAIEQWHFNPSGFMNPKMLYADDISLQAFFISWEESFRETGRCYKEFKVDSVSDIPNFSKYFEWYWTGKKRTYHGNIVFLLSRFRDLISLYEKEGFQPADKFGEFTKIGYSVWDVKKWLSNSQKTFWNVNLQFVQLCGMWWHMDFNFNLEKWETSIKMYDFYDLENFWGKWFSEFLTNNNPFKDRIRINMLFPMGYRGWVFPLINLTEIRLERNGKEQIFKHASWTKKVTKNTHRRIQWLI